MDLPPPRQLAGPSIETLEAMLDVTYTWGYQETRQKLRDLYDKARARRSGSPTTCCRGRPTSTSSTRWAPSS